MIDSQHVGNCLKKINNLLDACVEGRGRNEAIRTVEFLSDYTKKHFGDEENYRSSMVIRIVKSISSIMNILKENSSRNSGATGKRRHKHCLDRKN